jgi:hypothetical protein
MRWNADAALPVIKDADAGLTFSSIPASTYYDFSTPYSKNNTFRSRVWT